MLIYFSKADETGCGWYRIVLPERYLSKIGKHVTQLGNLTDLVANGLNLEHICVIQRQYNPEVFPLIRDKRYLDIPVIGELDDDFWSLRDDNPAKGFYNPEEIARREQEARESGKLREGENFLRTREALRDFLRMCTAITCSTEGLAKVLRQFNKNVFVLPNYVDHLVLPKIPTPPKCEKTMRILWTGGNSHRSDLVPLAETFRMIFPKYPNVKLVLLGFMSEEMATLKKDFEDRIEFHEGLPTVEAYYRLLSYMPSHIGLAPLVPDEFNTSKSFVKEIEMGLCGIYPVVQDFGPYSDLKEKLGKDSSLVTYVQEFTAQAWFDALVPLIENTEQVRERASEFQKIVLRDYTMMSNYHKWVEVYQKVLELPKNTWHPTMVPMRVRR